MRAIIIGAGLMGRHHAMAAMKAGASIAAIVDRDQNVAAKLARRFKGSVASTDIESTLADVEADLVHICTPDDSHQHLAETAARLGLHALIEKPMASNAEATSHLLNGFAEAGLLACPTHQYAFQRSVREARAALLKLGSVRQIAFDICSAGGERGMDLDQLVGEILPHPLAITQQLSPDSEIEALAWSCLRAAPGEWLISAPIGNAALSITMSMSGRPTRFLTRIIADRGSLELDNFHDYCVAQSGDVSRHRKIVQPFVKGATGLAAASANLIRRSVRGEFAYPGLQTLVSEFYAAARSPDSVRPPITPREAIAVAVARDKLIALATNG